MKAALLGPPHSGKSCLREGLKEAVRRSGSYLYVISAQPDGEGAWFQETASRDPELAAELKRANKRGFTWEFARVAADWVKNCEVPLALIDTGGRADDKNEVICRHASHAILLCPDADRFEEWRQFCDRIGLRVLAELVSDYDGTDDHVEPVGEDGILRARVHRLERGERVADRPAVRALAARMTE